MSVSDWLTTEFNQTKHPVYNSLGREIGYYTDLATLATGHIMLYQGETAPPSSELMVNCGIFATRKNAGDCLLSQGLTPAWATPDQVTGAQAANQPISFPDLLPSLNIDPNNWTLASSGIPKLPGLPSGLNLGTVALWGALGLLGIVIVRKTLA